MQKRFETHAMKFGFCAAIGLVTMVLFLALPSLLWALITVAIPAGTIWWIWRLNRQPNKPADVVNDSRVARTKDMLMPWWLRLLVIALNLASIRVIYLGYQLELAARPVRTIVLSVSLVFALVAAAMWYVDDRHEEELRRRQAAEDAEAADEAYRRTAARDQEE